MTKPEPGCYETESCMPDAIGRLAAILSILSLISSFAQPAQAAITGTTGALSVIAAPTSVIVGALESDTVAPAFEEKQTQVLLAPVAVDISVPGNYSAATPALTPALVPPGTTVNSYFVHGDAIGFGSTTLVGSITFDEQIIGIITEDLSLDATDAPLGSPVTAYPTGTVLRGLNFSGADVLNLSADRRTVQISWPVNFTTDQVRILTRASTEPGMTFSMDFQGPSRGAASSWGPNVFEGDILTPALLPPLGPWPPVFLPPMAPGPAIQSAGGGAGFGLGTTPTPAGITEVDALSYGNDRGNRVRFSVDEHAQGSGGLVNHVVREVAPPFPTNEAAADMFTYIGTIGTPVFGNVQYTDGNGDSWPGVGLVEPNPPTPTLPDPGDNLDAADLQTRSIELAGPVYVSLDASFQDPLEAAGGPANSGSALANGFVGGDVIVVPNTAAAVPTPVLYAPANVLGLDLVPNQGPDSDDLDALALNENGDMQFNPESGVFTDDVDWILFSVRRNSAVIGQIDSRLGIPIDAGDILTIPVPGGLSQFPAIVVRGEALGLMTIRSNPQCGLSPNMDIYFGCDDVDALDTFVAENVDSDSDGILDDVDNCTLVPNTNQRDTDGDGYGNVCDGDFNGDCITNAIDLGILKVNFFTSAPDQDIDGDGIVNVIDLGLFKLMFFLPPGPGIGFCP